MGLNSDDRPIECLIKADVFSIRTWELFKTDQKQISAGTRSRPVTTREPIVTSIDTVVCQSATPVDSYIADQSHPVT